MVDSEKLFSCRKFSQRMALFFTSLIFSSEGGQIHFECGSFDGVRRFNNRYSMRQLQELFV